MQRHSCRACKAEFPATTDFFYRAGDYFNWICKPCIKDYIRDHRRRRRGRTLRQLQCAQCGTPITIYEATDRKTPRRFCSYACGETFRAKEIIRELLAKKEELERWCLHCGEPIAPSKKIEAAYCSSRCNDAAHHLLRKLAGRAGTERRPLSRAALGDRDGWRCQICGQPVDRERQHPDPLAPSVDHRLPLACGGTNELANLQLAHLRCNLSKRHIVGDLQLRLVG
jgi:endogenous inhibitor of DNA gyrase (YacG/DUF329 family)